MTETAGPRILIIEDDQLLSGLLSQSLVNAKFDIQTAFTGEQGLEMVKQWKPDIVLLDIMLPGMDGIEVLTRIKNDPEIKKTRVIILSNLGQPSDVNRGTALGAEKYIVKVTLSLAEVVQMVKDTWKASADGAAAQSAA